LFTSHLEEETSIASALVTSGVTLLTQSPFTTTPPDALPKITTEMEAIGESTGRRFVYFVNATSKLQYVQAYVRALSKLVSHYVTFGLRVCPLSMGLNVCAWIRSRIPHPIYGYNLLPLGHRIDPSYELTPRSLATLLRLAGVDALNVGLKYQSIASGTAVPDYLRACRDPLPDDILPSLPMLTGGITPRVACRIVAAHGSKLGLHIKKPILRSGLHITKIKRNMKAFDQAVAIALSGRDIDEVVGAEARGTKALRSYERDFGQ
jgi:ribulose 1,5-bisphosphate carboxylase large subunit-like protein